jgi:hypothetical protein
MSGAKIKKTIKVVSTLVLLIWVSIIFGLKYGELKCSYLQIKIFDSFRLSGKDNNFDGYRNFQIHSNISFLVKSKKHTLTNLMCKMVELSDEKASKLYEKYYIESMSGLGSKYLSATIEESLSIKPDFEVK